ncbi:VAMP-associated protein [Xylariaceae sp. FL0594]|nr:VAMP-associated protein [Xylariaceae sp. FL0594]
MSVEIDPQELGFHRPFTVEVLENLRIRNTHSHPVAFKVKTTAPKQYCVRPNSGRVEPGKEVEVQVILQAMKQEPPPGTKCRDKFLVQSVAITPDKEFASLPEIWDVVEKSSIQEKKIRVAFLDPKPKAAPVNESAFVTPSKHKAASASVVTPETAPPAYTSPRESAAPPSERKPSVDDEAHSETQSTFTAAPAPVTPAKSEPSLEELKQQLKQAEALIAQLNQGDSGLRQRKTGASEEENPTSKPAELAQAVRAGTEGVPVHYTAILCLLSFLLAYIFF